MRTARVVLLAFFVFFLANWLDVWWLGATDFASDAFYDGSAALVTLALPALLAGLVIGLWGKSRAVMRAVMLFAVLGGVNLLHPLWRVPLVSPHSAHSGAMHYFLHSPFVLVTFGTLGAWLAGQLASGRWTLTDKEPVALPPD